MNTERTRTHLHRIRQAWSAETAAPGTGPNQGPRGQCAVTALLVQDWYGGEILRAVVEVEQEDGEYIMGPNGSEWSPKTRVESHYWNLIPGMGEIDLTRQQYVGDVEIPRGEVVPRSRLLDGERAAAARTAERYEILKRSAES